MKTYNLSRKQIEILEHANSRAAGGFYCGDSSDMDFLVVSGLMEFVGRKSFVPNGYYRLTLDGKTYLLERKSK